MDASGIPGITPARDLVERQFRPDRPNVLWVADITYLRTGEGWLYLAAVQDAYSRLIVSWSMATHTRAAIVVDALQMALAPAPRPGAHSPLRPGRAAQAQPVLATAPVDATVPSAGDGLSVGAGGRRLGVTRLSSRRLALRGGPERR
ncbi:MAG: DDE-type integrase/transposase/recombinase [Solirubrobacterales bacterium]|nr:DDE-type integrase/transposase/recombinase [Solirubrobacterales bacterium]MBV9941891.1 DDE-type integrase/transposase/recombinase [Solirubrobacterales bacterium]